MHVLSFLTMRNLFSHLEMEFSKQKMKSFYYCVVIQRKPQEKYKKRQYILRILDVLMQIEHNDVLQIIKEIYNEDIEY